MYDREAMRKHIADILQEIMQGELIDPVVAAFKPAADRVKARRKGRKEATRLTSAIVREAVPTNVQSLPKDPSTQMLNRCLLTCEVPRRSL